MQDLSKKSFGTTYTSNINYKETQNEQTQRMEQTQRWVYRKRQYALC